MAYVPRGKRKLARSKPPKFVRRRRGKPTPHATFLPTNQQLCYMLAARGASDEEIEQLCSVPKGTLAEWRKFYPSLDLALEKGRTNADAEVLYQMFRNATGYEFEEDAAVGGRDPCVLKVKRHARASVEAQKLWMQSRQREHWSPPQRHEHSGPNGTAIPIESRNKLLDDILGLIPSKLDNEKQKPSGR